MSQTARLIAAEANPLIRQYWARQHAAQVAADAATTDQLGAAMPVVEPTAEEFAAVAEWRAAGSEQYRIDNTAV